jgi:NADH-quinone oxidoreductase subunit C
MKSLSELKTYLASLLGETLLSSELKLGELTCEIDAKSITTVCQKLRDDKNTRFDQLIDLCAIDYSGYGLDETSMDEPSKIWEGSRYAVVYHLLSLDHNARIRLRISLDDNQPVADSIIDIFPVADWYEREAFDLMGIIFTGHPDLRRLLTDYGFIGHPFRKDFPLSGNVEMRYDEKQKRVIYQPVTVKERILVPRTIRKDTFVKSARHRVSE